MCRDESPVTSVASTGWREESLNAELHVGPPRTERSRPQAWEGIWNSSAGLERRHSGTLSLLSCGTWGVIFRAEVHDL